MFVQEGRTCDWEELFGRHELILELGRTSEPWKRLKTEEIRNKIRMKHGVPLPEDEDLHGPICDEMVRETGVQLKFVVGYYNYEKLVAYWRRNREKFLERRIHPLTEDEKIEKSRKKEEEWQALREKVREIKARKYNEGKRTSEMEEKQKRVVGAQMEAMKAVVGDLPTNLPRGVVDVGVGEGMDEAARQP